MRAIQVTRFGGPEVLVPTELDAPVAGPDQLLVTSAPGRSSRPRPRRPSGSWRWSSAQMLPLTTTRTGTAIACRRQPTVAGPATSCSSREERPDVGGQYRWLFEGREMAAVRVAGPTDDVVGLGDLVPERDEVLVGQVEEGRRRGGRVGGLTPVRRMRALVVDRTGRSGGAREPVEHHVREEYVAVDRTLRVGPGRELLGDPGQLTDR